MSKVEAEPAKAWKAVRMHLHGATNLFGDQATNVSLATLSPEIQSGGVFVTNPRDPSKGQLVPWAGIKTVLYERG